MTVKCKCPLWDLIWKIKLFYSISLDEDTILKDFNNKLLQAKCISVYYQTQNHHLYPNGLPGIWGIITT